MHRLLVGTLALACSCAAQDPPVLTPRPVIYASEEEVARAMRSAPVILVVEMIDGVPTGDHRMVEKPPGTAGPQEPAIPLELARFRAKVLLTLRGPERTEVEFYSWVWTSGKHGGPRLFRPYPGSGHVIFLRQEGEYLHTVGDYPSYDLEFDAWVMPWILSAWHSVPESLGDPLARIVAARFHAELDNIPASEWSGDRGMKGINDLEGLVGPLLIATQLDGICRAGTNQFGRIVACTETGTRFLGRCQAFRIANEVSPDSATVITLAKQLANCQDLQQNHLRDNFSTPESLEALRDSYRKSRQGLEWIRAYAAAMDPKVHQAYCALAATMPEVKDIPECAVSGQKQKPD